MTDSLATSIARLFDEHSVPLDISEVTKDISETPTVRLIVGKDRRLVRSGPAIAAAVFVAVAVVGFASLALTRGGGDSVEVSVAPPTTAVPTTVPSAVAEAPATSPTSTIGDALPSGPAVAYPGAPFALIESPLVVQEVPLGAEPDFATEPLGLETPLRPFDELAIAQIELETNEFPIVEGVPIVALGRVDGLLAFRLTVSAFDSVYVCDWGVGTGDLARANGRPWPLGECAFGLDPRPDVTIHGRTHRTTLEASDLPAGSLGDESSLTTGTWVSQVFWSSLPETVSVVSVSVTGQESSGLWQRPVGGVAVFVVRSVESPVLELTAYASDGAVVDRRSAELAPGGVG